METKRHFCTHCDLIYPLKEFINWKRQCVLQNLPAWLPAYSVADCWRIKGDRGMYNRYIPQQDGTYLKNRIPTPQPPPEHPKPSPPCGDDAPPYRHPNGAFSFLKQLIPNQLDTGDLMIIILLLLMAGDNDKERNNWLLTLALYLFL
jgi:hypothetical protein